MREGKNPEKDKKKELKHHLHRVIIPFYIPNTQEDYFRDAILIFKTCVESIWATTGEETVITLINNGSCDEAHQVALTYFTENKVDQYIIKKENRGKADVVINAARSTTEDFITIADADILFKTDWFLNVLTLFEKFPKTGVVSPIPVPHIYLNSNYSCLIDNFPFKIRKGKVVSNEDIDAFYESIDRLQIGNTVKGTQHYIQEKETKALIGAGHAVATYRRELFIEQYNKKVPYVFYHKMKLLQKYLDILSEQYGLWRLSTTEAYAVHMGNVYQESYKVEKGSKPVEQFKKRGLRRSRMRFVPLSVKKKIAIFIHKIYKVT